MKKMKDMLNSLSEEVSVTKLDLALGVTAGVLFGMVVGLLTSPKGKRIIGSNNNSNNYRECLDGEIWEDFDEDEAEN